MDERWYLNTYSDVAQGIRAGKIGVGERALRRDRRIGRSQPRALIICRLRRIGRRRWWGREQKTGHHGIASSPVRKTVAPCRERSAPILERPIFLMGSGRCGSTFFQRQFSRTGLIWIWGEHDGVIGRLLKWADDAASDKALKEFAFKMETSQIEAVFDLACGQGCHFRPPWRERFSGP